MRVVFCYFQYYITDKISGEDMGVLARKSKKGVVYRYVGIIVCFIVLIPMIKAAISLNGKQKIFAIVASVIVGLIIIGLGWGIIFDILRPDDLIKRDGNALLVFSRGKWNELDFSEIINVSFRNNQSGRTVLSFGTIVIETIEKNYRVENVENVALAWSEIMNICGQQKAN